MIELGQRRLYSAIGRFARLDNDYMLGMYEV